MKRRYIAPSTERIILPEPVCDLTTVSIGRTDKETNNFNTDETLPIHGDNENPGGTDASWYDDWKNWGGD